MPELTVTIGGRAFPVACQDGEEHFLRSAAAMLDAEAQPLVAHMGRLPEAKITGLAWADAEGARPMVNPEHALTLLPAEVLPPSQPRQAQPQPELRVATP